MKKLLLVDDDRELVNLVRDYLVRESFEVEVAHDGESGLARALQDDIALVVLDVMMPGMNGVEVLRNLRQQRAVPVLMLTARGDEADKIVGLELGADDYVSKPCSAREIAARVRAILRRADPAQRQAGLPVEVGELSVWPDRRIAYWQGQALNLTSSEFNLLELLARKAGKVVSKNELSEYGLGRPAGKFDRSIEVHVNRIREKLPPLADGRSRVQTVFRQGYLLVQS